MDSRYIIERRSMTLKDINNINELKNYLINKGSNHSHGYSHYTNLEGLLGMIRSKHFWLSRMDQMNDKQERSKLKIDNWNSIFAMSLIYGTNENMAMWGLYGIPSEDAIRITFESKHINKLIYDTKDYYDISNYGKLNAFKNLDLVDVLYIGVSDKENCNHVLKKGAEEIYHLNLYNTGNLRDIQNGDMFAGMLKNAAWSYEKW